MCAAALKDQKESAKFTLDFKWKPGLLSLNCHSSEIKTKQDSKPTIISIIMLFVDDGQKGYPANRAYKQESGVREKKGWGGGL